MTDAEILYTNILRICKARKLKLTQIEKKAGYHKGHLNEMARNGYRVTVEAIRYYAQALEVPMARLMEGMFDD